MKILIHSCIDREWYVEEYLIPRIKELDKGNRVEIVNYVDRDKLGNQRAFIDSIEKNPDALWHLQDDVWVSNDFIRTLITYEDIPGVICGFGTRAACRGMVPGWTDVNGMYTSFQCIRIPKVILERFHDYVINRYTHEIITDKWDDALFREFMLRSVPFYPVLNLSPSIVEHIDYLIGGSVINQNRKYLPKAIEFDEKSLNLLIERLEKGERI